MRNGKPGTHDSSCWNSITFGAQARSGGGVESGDRITGEERVGGDKGQALALRLGDEYAVEGIAVVRRQRADSEGVIELNGKRAETASG
jgi:hypothetical protein